MSRPDYLNERERRKAVADLLADALELPAGERAAAVRDAMAKLSRTAVYVVPETDPPEPGCLTPAGHRAHVVEILQRALDGPADELPEMINLAIQALLASAVRPVLDLGVDVRGGEE